jgi:tellurite resistance protein
VVLLAAVAEFAIMPIVGHTAPSLERKSAKRIWNIEEFTVFRFLGMKRRKPRKIEHARFAGESDPNTSGCTPTTITVVVRARNRAENALEVCCVIAAIWF